jgi:iron complex outermembrane receptor protein
LDFTNIYIEESKIGVVADSTGFFQFSGLCPSTYHLRLSHVGCETERIFISLERDTFMFIYLQHHVELLDEVVVHGTPSQNITVASSTLGKETISGEANKNLSDILEHISGVSSLKTGSGISKPVIHGLYGNRVTILNNGIAQAGQQWGNDHAPEIDPFVADHISVIKGAGSVAYGGNSLGSIVLIEPDEIINDPHFHGEVNYIFQSNGLGHSFNSQLEKSGKWAAWKAIGTLKAIGDLKSPEYYLTNTGKREQNIAFQLLKNPTDRWKTNIYYSLFNTQIGILRGSHIGNLTDLEEAIGRDEPFFTKNRFSYSIEEPRQRVQHHLLKLESTHLLHNDRSLNIIYAGQLNDRQEFDVRKSGRSDIPALSVKQLVHTFKLGYTAATGVEGLFKSGLHFNFIDNTNDPETGILPLIPDYRSVNASGYAIFQKDFRNIIIESGLRYAYKDLQVLKITKTTPKTIERFDHGQHNVTVSLGAKYQSTEKFKISLNTGFIRRSPEVNELYSSGLHQGVSGIEEGNNNLLAEKSIKGIVSADWSIASKAFISLVGYYQHVEDYIFLEPQEEYRLTIRGAFPVFLYQQTDARLIGGDLSLTIEPNRHLRINSDFGIVRGKDLTNNEPLIYIPADNLKVSITYFPDNKKGYTNPFFTIKGHYAFMQERVPAEQDFLPPPEGYFLLGIKAGMEFDIRENQVGISVTIENLLNTSYRDYLNRLRYFADEPGINANVRINYQF